MIGLLLIAAFFWSLAGLCYATLRRYPGNIMLVTVGVVAALVGCAFIVLSSLE